MACNNNLCPLDNRYASQVEEVSRFFSQFHYTKLQIEIELRYFSYLITNFCSGGEKCEQDAGVQDILEKFDEEEYGKVIGFEKETRHDVKAVEYYIRDVIERRAETSDAYRIMKKHIEFVHFGLTSQDINSVTYTRLLQVYSGKIMKNLSNLMSLLRERSSKEEKTVILSRTHGQFATPTTIGYQLEMFRERLNREFKKLYNFEYLTKFGGATGNMDAHTFCFPDVDWDRKLTCFLYLQFNMKRQKFTKQTDPNDWMAEYLQINIRINNILIGLCQDIWQYISYGYFLQEKAEGQVGSSTMPHKINPIQFENAEGNLQLSNSLLNFISNKVTITRLQRDLSDSTVLRNLGMTFGYQHLAIDNIKKGILGLKVNQSLIDDELENHYEVLFEPLQSLLRIKGYPNSYDVVKNVCHGTLGLKREEFLQIVENMEISQEIKDRISSLTPKTYSAPFLARGESSLFD